MGRCCGEVLLARITDVKKGEPRVPLLCLPGVGGGEGGGVEPHGTWHGRNMKGTKSPSRVAAWHGVQVG